MVDDVTSFLSWVSTHSEEEMVDDVTSFLHFLGEYQQ